MILMILAGGLGTRLHPITKDKYPKCMVDVNGKPFLYYLLKDLIEKASIDKFVLLVGHKHKQIINHFGDNFEGVPIEYHIETTPLGTGGAVKNALRFIDEVKYLVVVNGDTLTDANYQEILYHHLKTNADATIAINNGVRAGVYILSKKIIEEFEDYGNIDDFLLKTTKWFMTDLIHPNHSNIEYFGGVKFIDIGTPEEYERFTRQKSN